MLAFLREDIKQSREHELKLFKFFVYPRWGTAVNFLSSSTVLQSLYAPRRPTLSNWHILLCQDVPECARMYGGEPTGRPLPATTTAIVMSDLLHNIMYENASSSHKRPINRDL